MFEWLPPRGATAGHTQTGDRREIWRTGFRSRTRISGCKRSSIGRLSEPAKEYGIQDVQFPTAQAKVIMEETFYLYIVGMFKRLGAIFFFGPGVHL